MGGDTFFGKLGKKASAPASLPQSTTQGDAQAAEDARVKKVKEEEAAQFAALDKLKVDQELKNKQLRDAAGQPKQQAFQRSNLQGLGGKRGTILTTPLGAADDVPRTGKTLLGV